MCQPANRRDSMNRVDAEASRRVIMLDTGEDETLDRLLETLKAVQEEGSPDKETGAGES